MIDREFGWWCNSGRIGRTGGIFRHRSGRFGLDFEFWRRVDLSGVLDRGAVIVLGTVGEDAGRRGWSSLSA